MKTSNKVILALRKELNVKQKPLHTFKEILVRAIELLLGIIHLRKL